MKKQNVIIIVIDGGRLDWAQNSDLFNNLKNKSAFFSNSITYGPHTIAAMHAILSGTYGTRNGTNSYWSTYEFKKDKFKTITEYLKENNFFTCADLHSEIVIPKQGFDQFQIHQSTDDLKKRHSDLLEQIHTKCNNEENFFLYLHYSTIHNIISEQVLKKYDNFDKDYFDSKQLNYDRYNTEFKKAEQYLSSIMNKITSLKLDNNSLILILSDHGISIGEKFGERAYGAFCYDYTIKTFAYLLGNTIKPIEITQQVRTIDFMPTILEYLEINHDNNFEKMDGISLSSLISSKTMEEKIAFSETGNPLKEKKPPKQPNTKSVRTSKWKLIFNEYDNSKELYDLENDPTESENLIGTNSEIEEQLWNQLLIITKNVD
tara:strand:- start:34 stop:1158 length:1125 start_codon:yes stop_codon:yes gene_type:complete